MSEAKYMEENEDLYYDDCLDSYREDLAHDRHLRKQSLKGKYVIICDGKRGKVFLQDQRISRKHHWTKFLENAISFNHLLLAKNECNKFKFNNPRVVIVTSNFELIAINKM